jgi:hypothetical protein
MYDELSYTFKNPEAVEDGLTGMKNVLGSLFSIGAEYTKDLKCPKR